MQKYSYSVIIPHKNIPNLLKRCLDSIPKREDIQVIVVDDNSDPRKVDFANFPGLNQSNIEVYFDKSGVGAGRARNVGLKHAKGEWVLFLDADDIFTEGINSILDKLKTCTEDIVYFYIESRDSDTLEETDEGAPFNNTLKNGDDFHIRYRMLPPWMKAIRKSLIDNNDITFEEVPCANDTRFSTICGYWAKSIAVIPIVGYCWMRRKNSLWQNKSASSLVTRYEVQLRLVEFYKQHNLEAVAKEFMNDAYYFISQLEYLSKTKYFIGMLRYGFANRDLRIFFLWTPRYICHCIKLACGVDKGICEFIKSKCE